MSAAEFLKVVDNAKQSGQLKFGDRSAAFLDETIEFGEDLPVE